MWRISVFAVMCVAAVSAGCVSTGGHKYVSGKVAESMGIATGFINKTMTVDGGPRAYEVYVPREYDPSKPWPLIVFLHGAGERGHDGILETEVGIGPAIRRHAGWFPCLVVMPQCPPHIWWDGAAQEIGLAIEQTRREYNIDPDRIYLTGLSMGGYATWIYGARHIDEFAALLPVCGGGNPADAPKLATVPIWAFHGSLDDVVLPTESRRMVEAVRKAGGTIRYTEYPELKHNCWDATYNNAKVIHWLLEQRRKR